MSTLSNFATFLILTVGALFSFFIFWELLKDDYEDTRIFPLGLLIVLGGILGFSLVGWIFGRDHLLGGLIFVFLFAFLRSKRLAMRPVEVFEAVVPSLFVFLFFFSLNTLRSAGKFYWYSFTEPLLLFGALCVFWVLKKYYRSFLWYPSGKVGFASLVAVIIYLIARTAIAVLFPHVLFLMSRGVSIATGVSLALVCSIVVYFQSGRIEGDMSRIRRVFAR
ncbi:MAG: hypothetical protein AAB694_00345 [Patescibacteria group bacterium]